MEQTYNKEKFSKFIHVVQIIVKVLKIILFIILGILGIAFIISAIIPQSRFEVDLSRFENLNVRISSIVNAVDPDLFDQVVNIKRFIVTGLIGAILNTTFVTFILIQLSKLLGNVKEEPFNLQNSLILKSLGIGYFVASIVLKTYQSVVSNAAFQTVGIDQHGTAIGINLQYVFMGVLILILSYIFSYGSYLQEEHDATL